MENSSLCVRCERSFPLGDEMHIFDVRCPTCRDRFCGRCFKTNHYPAICEGLGMWQARHEFANQPFMEGRLNVLDQHWSIIDEIIEFVDEVKELHGASDRFSCKVLTYGADLVKWLYLDCCFCPIFEFHVRRKLDILRNQMVFLASSLPRLPLNTAYRAEWIGSKLVFIICKLIELMALVGSTRNEVRGTAGGYLDATASQLEQQEVASDMTIVNLSVQLRVASLM